MTLTACQKDEGLVSDGATSQTITVTIPQGMQTRATAADFGNGAKIDRCYGHEIEMYTVEQGEKRDKRQ